MKILLSLFLTCLAINAQAIKVKIGQLKGGEQFAFEEEDYPPTGSTESIYDPTKLMKVGEDYSVVDYDYKDGKAYYYGPNYLKGEQSGIVRKGKRVGKYYLEDDVVSYIDKNGYLRVKRVPFIDRFYELYEVSPDVEVWVDVKDHERKNK